MFIENINCAGCYAFQAVQVFEFLSPKFNEGLRNVPVGVLVGIKEEKGK